MADKDKLLAKISELKEQIKQKNEAIDSMRAIIYTYMNFIEALNPDTKAFDKAMKKLNKR